MSTRLLLEGTDLPELMAHVRAEFGPSARIVRAERVRSGGFAGFFARQRYELTVDVADEPHTRPRSMRQHPEPVGIEALLAAADAAEVGGLTGAPGQALAPLPGQGVAPGPGEEAGPRVSTGAEAFASVLDQVRAMAGGEAIADVEVPAPAARRFEPLAPATAPSSTTGVNRDALRDLGVPEHYLARLPGSGPVLLSTVLEALPVAPRLPRTPGAVVVVVGPPVEALAVAVQLAERLGQPTSSVVLAGRGEAAPGHGRRMTTAATARRWRGRPEKDDQVAVVALGVGPDAASRAEAAELLEAFSPDQVCGVVDAHSKLRDCARWLAETGARRRVDVLAVRGVFETTQPGTVLDLGVPVAWIDGLPATRVAWAAVLSDRLDAGARWD
ncbi:hypothetical protein [Cellulomonas chengniuliangii]|uniref:Uncharacterized protein n=1 Tax=Cellulomonas chengniuliangii TaxID=2968084 RepID=A0ABY5L2P3_9CELL|nr:hypothetical protein [Cellulomonas chengniuliangii]MCC2307248.1 hypothetical protein [Cellulomonas chengniuliangii]MCC2317856.1 hypothetical protein [Cellulomonas chengniuliangii]UUI75956.1 hypothetical protein NP064_03360 [Cellulomonas chengniuliangii]